MRRSRAYFCLYAELRSVIKNRPTGELDKNCRILVRFYAHARTYFSTKSLPMVLSGFLGGDKNRLKRLIKTEITGQKELV